MLCHIGTNFCLRSVKILIGDQKEKGLYVCGIGARGGVVVKALRYKLAGRGFDSRWCHWNFSVTSFRSHYGPGVDSASNRNEYQLYFLGLKAAGA